jgi:hypothetical protein
MAEILCADHFAPFVGKTFQAEGHPQLLTLVTLDRHGAGGTSGGREPFSLILCGPAGDVVPEGFYRFIADGRQEFELYMMPIQTASRERQDYQIVFN